tara:strand:+ start:766 stop:1095 length:330 start_codon:yes stop_codon:yes gene_type:complete
MEKQLMRYLLSFYVPVKDSELVKSEIFKTGAGTLGQYEMSCWQTTGLGQFKPLPGSNPSIGSVNKLETVEEIKVEILCSDITIKSAVDALKKYHPYEEPAYFVVKMASY